MGKNSFRHFIKRNISSRTYIGIVNDFLSLYSHARSDYSLLWLFVQKAKNNSSPSHFHNARAWFNKLVWTSVSYCAPLLITYLSRRITKNDTKRTRVAYTWNLPQNTFIRIRNSVWYKNFQCNLVQH